MVRPWEVDPAADFKRRLGKSAAELGESRTTKDCPDIWELDNGDIAIVGRDATTAYSGRLPLGVSIGADERLVVIPGSMLRAAKPDIADA
ncbi:hypothetical protein [Allonocardiopsis opalescens]|uniref:Uncharacterized protein n=1 Tax=Allonocardiopsis opalescens TaxID=1144618 RepID=A0A2T0Q9K4_9ACTN|nr:hypothetical protein [Allonocardiopsis opalescens]PRY00490.1 hypothetical protein CLV72_102121 [Allonocardiopsis opalescens]